MIIRLFVVFLCAFFSKVCAQSVGEEVTGKSYEVPTNCAVAIHIAMKDFFEISEKNGKRDQIFSYSKLECIVTGEKYIIYFSPLVKNLRGGGISYQIDVDTKKIVERVIEK